jgi:hypothetical protein
MNHKEGFQNETELIKIIQDSIESYTKKEKDISEEDWIKNELGHYNIEIDDAEVELFCNEISDIIEINNQNIHSINSAMGNGVSKEIWLQQKIQDSSIGISINDLGNYLQGIDNSLSNSNELMKELIINNNGSISQNMNLDGFIFEQHHANSFNLDVALKGGKYKAEALKPKPGETFNKNSVDLIIKNSKGNVVRRYQAKFSGESKSANTAFKRGNYKFQRKLVAKGQIGDVPNSTESIGFKKYKSVPLSKSEGKDLQKLAQSGQKIEVDWNYYKLKDLTAHMTKNVAMAGIQSAAITVGYDLVYKTIAKKEIEINEVVGLALKTGADSWVKTSVTVALKIASEKGLLKVIPPGTPPAILANIATVSVENVKVLNKVAKGELSVTQGLQQIERVTVATVAGLLSAELGALKGGAIGAIALSWIPVVGTPVGAVLGGIIGGTVGYMAGSTIGGKICETVQKVRKAVTTTLRAGARVVGKSVSKAKDFVKSLF